LLPPGAVCSQLLTDDVLFSLTAADGKYEVAAGSATICTETLRAAVQVLDSLVRAYIALNAPDHIFVHAAVVAIGGRAVVIPGPSFTGKTTLAAALVRAGATYYSDEFAVLDGDGLVHPYPRPLSIRVDGGAYGVDHPVEALGGSAGTAAIPVALVAITRYVVNGTWKPRRISAARGALALLASTVPARHRPAQALDAIVKVVAHAAILDGDRGQAHHTALRLLAAARDHDG
jgi:hypothetical protein